MRTIAFTIARYVGIFIFAVLGFAMRIYFDCKKRRYAA